MLKILFIILPIFFLNTFAYAQNIDCEIYEMALNYINDKYANIKEDYVYDDSLINPENPGDGKYVNKTYKEQLSFYLIKNKNKFDNDDVKYWFSQLVRDNALIQFKYTSGMDSIIDCSLSCCLKYQYRNFEEVREFTNSDFSMEINGYDTIHYKPMRITLSKVLYAKDIALVYAKFFSGLGSGRDTAVYGFVFRKKDKKWILQKAEVQVN